MCASETAVCRGGQKTPHKSQETPGEGGLLLLLKKGLSRSDCCCPQLPPPPPPSRPPMPALDAERRLQRIMIHLYGIAFKSLNKHDTKQKPPICSNIHHSYVAAFCYKIHGKYCIEKESSNFLPVLLLPTYRPCHGQAANLPPPPPPPWQLTLPHLPACERFQKKPAAKPAAEMSRDGSYTQQLHHNQCFSIHPPPPAPVVGRGGGKMGRRSSLLFRPIPQVYVFQQHGRIGR